MFLKTTSDIKQPKESLYGVPLKSLSGQTIDLSEFEGKHILFVNVASKCGFTPQYKDLQELHSTYNNKLVVIGVPCNQFGHQEPGKAEEIESFCEVNYGVTFLITEKLDVKGNNQHPLYAWLTQKEKNGTKSTSVRWNFQKYLIDDEGNWVDYYYSNTNPMSNKITKHFR